MYTLEAKDGDGWVEIASSPNPTPLWKFVENQENPEDYRVTEREAGK